MVYQDDVPHLKMSEKCAYLEFILKRCEMKKKHCETYRKILNDCKQNRFSPAYFDCCSNPLMYGVFQGNKPSKK